MSGISWCLIGEFSLMIRRLTAVSVAAEISSTHVCGRQAKRAIATDKRRLQVQIQPIALDLLMSQSRPVEMPPKARAIWGRLTDLAVRSPYRHAMPEEALRTITLARGALARGDLLEAHAALLKTSVQLQDLSPKLHDISEELGADAQWLAWKADNAAA